MAANNEALMTIQAAINKLDRLSAGSWPGEFGFDNDNSDGSSLECFVTGEYGIAFSTGYVGNGDSRAHSELAAAGMNSAPVIREFLVVAVHYIKSGIRFGLIETLALDLSRAILVGSES